MESANLDGSLAQERRGPGDIACLHDSGISDEQRSTNANIARHFAKARHSARPEQYPRRQPQLKGTHHDGESGNLTRPSARFLETHRPRRHHAMTIRPGQTIIAGVMTMPAVTLSDPAVLAFVVIPLGLLGALLWGTHAAARHLHEDDAARRHAMLITVVVSAVWMTATWRAAESGVLRLWDATPPPFAVLVVGILGVAAVLACTVYGRRLALGLPLWVLVGIQGFRLPLELAMHAMYERGVMPEQMSYSGRNFDIVTGITALIVAWLVARVAWDDGWCSRGTSWGSRCSSTS